MSCHVNKKGPSLVGRRKYEHSMKEHLRKARDVRVWVFTVLRMSRLSKMSRINIVFILRNAAGIMKDLFIDRII